MHRNASSSDSVNRRFHYVVSTIYVVVLTLVLWLFAEQWIGYQNAREAQREFVVLHAALRAMSDISAERRPTFAQLNQSPETSEQQTSALEVARHATDADLQALGTTLRDPRCKQCVSLAATYAQVMSILFEARQDLDAINMQEPGDHATAVLHAFERLVTAIPLLSSIADTSATGVIRQNADVQSYLLSARLAALLRERAGALASPFAPALTSHRAMTNEETARLTRTLGAIEQLQTLLAPSIRSLPPALQSDYAEVTEQFFNQGLSYIDNLQSLAHREGGAVIGQGELVEKFGTRVVPIDRFRDDTLALARQTIRESLRLHVMLLVGTGVLASALTGVLLLVSWRFREKIVRPFVEARRLILAIAAGDLSMAIPLAGYRGEIKDLFGALNVLKQNSADRIRLELERKRLIAELRTIAATDPLTGLLNRRAFESRARLLLSDKRGDEIEVALIMLDIDYFKHINDSYGHETGDRTLVKLAAICRETVRSEDVVARIGGEEFVILLRVSDHMQACELAQRLRDRLHQETIVAISGDVFGITASFGIAFAQRADSPKTAELLRRADALLYQAKQNGRDRIEAEASA